MSAARLPFFRWGPAEATAAGATGGVAGTAALGDDVDDDVTVAAPGAEEDSDADEGDRCGSVEGSGEGSDMRGSRPHLFPACIRGASSTATTGTLAGCSGSPVSPSGA